jgi:hypothetical protein
MREAVNLKTNGKLKGTPNEPLTCSLAANRTIKLILLNSTRYEINLCAFQCRDIYPPALPGGILDTGEYIAVRDSPPGVDITSDPCSAGKGPIQAILAYCRIEVNFMGGPVMLRAISREEHDGGLIITCTWKLQTYVTDDNVEHITIVQVD